MSERDIFIAALQIAGSAERSAYLDQACANDAALRQRVEVLLQAHDNAGSFLNKPPVQEAVTGEYHDVASVEASARREPAEQPGTRIGPYKLLQQIGEGGMGNVWMAEQTEPVKRMLALKLIKAGMDTAQVLARFEAERQALALMEHPNIAKVLDAGTTANGRPFFVMELVKGVPITKYCDEHQLTPRERLELFVPVCHAIQHAHQKGIIHRDIKPGNVLIASFDGKPVPKVIDFGVAKATALKLTERTLFTGFGGIVGTLEYMSPEQAEFNALDIDTRSDIYALGVLLYELLTGTTPLTRKRLRAAALEEALRIIREEEPSKPSTRLSESKDSLSSVAARRKMEPAKLTRLVRGDLDWLVMKALEKDRNRRYETANGFALDIERYLHDELVLARPPSAGYRLRKFARRNKGRLAAAVLLLLVAGLSLVGAGLGWLWRESEEARTKIEAARQDEQDARELAEGARIDEEKAKNKLTDQLKVDEQTNRDLAAARDQLARYLYVDRIALAYSAFANREFKRARDLMESCEQQHRGWEWHHLNLKIPQELYTLAGHEDAVRHVRFSPDGQILASASVDKTVKLWNTASGKVLHTLAGHQRDVLYVSFSPNGRTLASASSDDTAKLWDAASGKELHTLVGHKGAVLDVSFSPDGRTLASASFDSTVKLWDAATGKELHTLVGHNGGVLYVSFSLNGRILASASFDNSLKVWDAASGKELHTLVGHKGAVLDMSFSPDGRTLASASLDNTFKLWDAATGKELASLAGHKGTVEHVRFSPDGRTLASASGITAKLWDAASGKELHTLVGHNGHVQHVSFSPDGQTLASASDDATVKLWDAATGKELATLAGDRRGVNHVSFSPAGRTLASTSGITVKLWDAASGKELVSLGGHKRDHTHIPDVSFSPDGRTLASAGAGFDGTVKLWDMATGKELHTLLGHNGVVPQVSFSPDGRTLASAGMDDCTVKLWDASSGKDLHTLAGHQRDVLHVSFSPSGRTLASASVDKTVKLWNAASGKVLHTLAGHTDVVQHVRFSPDGQILASASFDKTVKLWDVASGKALASLAGHKGNVEHVRFSPDGRTLASASTDETVKLWDATSGKEVHTLAGCNRDFPDVRFSPDGRTLASASYDDTVKLWDVASGRKLHTLAGHKNGVIDVRFSPDGRTLASGSMDMTVKLWDVATGKELASLAGHKGTVEHVRFSPDGRTLASASYDGTVKLWFSQVDAGTWAERKRLMEEQQAAELYQSRQWFAAAFHLRRLLKDRPNDSELQKQLRHAEAEWEKERYSSGK